MSPVKVIHVISTLEVGGVESQLLELVRRLDRRRYACSICCLTGGGPLLEQFRQAGIKVTILRRRFRFDLSLIPQLVRLLKEEGVQLVHTYMFTGNSWGTLAARIAHVPIIVNSVRDIEVWKRWPHRFIDRRLFPYVDVVVTNSRATRDFMIKEGKLAKGKFVTVYNGVDTSNFSAGRGVDKKGNFILGTAARLDEPKKGLAYLIGAIDIIRGEVPRCQLLIVGDGPSRGTLEDLVRERKLEGEVKFLGLRRDIPQLLAKMDIFVLPSLWEGLGNVLLEAMAMRRPVVATQVGGIPEVVSRGKTGFLVPPGDSAALAAAILELWKSPEMRKEMGRAGRKRVEENFSIEGTVEGFQAIYDELIERKITPH